MRSVDPGALAALEKRLLAIIGESVAAENGARSTKAGAVKADPKLIGDRPAGRTDPATPLVQAALAANRAFGVEPALESSSTDANIPMSLGVPSLTIGSGSGGGRSHSLDEYLDVPREPFVKGLSVGLAIVLGAAGAR
jgi:di/tripeptidase